MGKTSIEWCDFSINPIRARSDDGNGHYCEKVSPGCAHCYASRLQPRFRMPTFDVQRRTNVVPYLNEPALMEVLSRKKPTRFFWCDMSDMFGSWVPDEWIDRCFAVMALTPQHTHLVLTKRASRLLAYLGNPETPGRIDAQFLNPPYLPLNGGRVCLVQPNTPRGLEGWPLPNVHVGVSVEDQARADERLPIATQVSAAGWNVMVSMEPLLGRIGLAKHFPHVHGLRNDKFWVIVGGESGPGARPCDLAWIRSIVQQCQAASVPVFVKQLGSVPMLTHAEREGTGGCVLMLNHRNARRIPDGYEPILLRDRKGGEISGWPEDLRVRQFPEAAQ